MATLRAELKDAGFFTKVLKDAGFFVLSSKMSASLPEISRAQMGMKVDGNAVAWIMTETAVRFSTMLLY